MVKNAVELKPGMSKYLKAFIGTLVFLLIGFAAVSYLDGSRVEEIAKKAALDSAEFESINQLLFYESVYGKDAFFCSALEKAVDSQVQRTWKALSEFEKVRQQNFLGDVDHFKKIYLNQNTQLYFLAEKLRAECGGSNFKPVIYFYPDKYYCAECAAQAKILDSVASECKSARVFAFPGDLEIPIIGLLMQKFGVEKYPSLVLGGEKFDFIVTKTQLKEKLEC